MGLERLLERRAARRRRASPSTVRSSSPSAWAASMHAGLDRPAVDDDRARAAVAGVAPDVRAGQLELVAQEVHEQPARVDLALVAHRR